MVEIAILSLWNQVQQEKPVSTIKTTDSANKKYKMHVRISKKIRAPHCS